MPRQQPAALILHADDFGFNVAVTEGIVEAFRAGLLTGTSLLTNAPAAELAVEQWRRLECARRAEGLSSQAARRQLGDPDAPFDLGAHLNLTQGTPLTADVFPGELLDGAGCFPGPGALYRRLCLRGRRWAHALRDELRAQICWLLDRGLTPTHLNGHQYVEMMPVVSEIIVDLTRQYQVPYVRAAVEPGHWRTSLLPGVKLGNFCLSHVKQHYARRWATTLDRAGVAHAAAFFGSSHAGHIDLAIMRHFLRHTRKRLLAEIAFHPGRPPREADAQKSIGDWHDPLALARPSELAMLCSAQFAELLATNSLQLARFPSAAGHRPRRAGIHRLAAHAAH